MIRTFDEHAVRKVISLDRRWYFTVRKPTAMLPDIYEDTIQVPGAWEQKPGLEAYRGRAWYQTSIEPVPGKALRLVFGGVSHTADVYVDAVKVAHHYDAFTPFDVIVPDNGAGIKRTLTVAVDNSFGKHSALHTENDYYTYGGITRPVVAEWVAPVYIRRMRCTPERNAGGWQLNIEVTLENWTAEDRIGDLVLSAAGQTDSLSGQAVPAQGQSVVRRTVNCPGVQEWNSDSPALYPVSVNLENAGMVVDDLIDRVGFRDVCVSGRQLLLNGEPVKLHGFNRHEDHPSFGNALPLQAIANDLEIMRDLGANFLRTCHYPNDQRMLDLCDELGIYVWEESHARTISFEHPAYKKQITQSTEEMLAWHHNHPCILIWGCLNECASHTDEGAEEHGRVLRLIKERDPSRPVTFASNKGQRDKAFEHVDIVSLNRYPGWYGDCGNDDPNVETFAAISEELESLLNWLHSPDSCGGNGKPVIMSEFGAGAIYGCRNPNRAKWTEEFQRDALDEYLNVYLNHPDICGAAIWQFCDARVTRSKWRDRPRTMNNKGIVDEYRRPKLAYEVVKKHLKNA